MFFDENKVDWALAELLAYGTLYPMGSILGCQVKMLKEGHFHTGMQF